MSFDETLIEYGRLKLEEQEINLKIGKEVKRQHFNVKEDGEQIQLFRYFDFNKNDLEYGDRQLELEEWAEEIEEELKQETYDLLELIKERRIIRFDLSYSKGKITKRAIKMYKENNNEY